MPKEWTSAELTRALAELRENSTSSVQWEAAQFAIQLIAKTNPHRHRIIADEQKEAGT